MRRVRKSRGVKRGSRRRCCHLKDNKHAKRSLPPPPTPSLLSSPPPPSPPTIRRSIVSYAIYLPFRSHPISLPPFRILSPTPWRTPLSSSASGASVSVRRALRWLRSPNAANESRATWRRVEGSALSGNARPRSEATTGTSCCPPSLLVRYPVTPCRRSEDFIPSYSLALSSCDRRSSAHRRKANYAISTFAYVHPYANEARVRTYSARGDKVDFASGTKRRLFQNFETSRLPKSASGTCNGISGFKFTRVVHVSSLFPNFGNKVE